MSISIVNRANVTTGGPDATTGAFKADQYLDFVDNGTTVATLSIPASGATPTFDVDGSDIVTESNAATLGIQTVYSASVTLTDAQVKALPTTGVTVVAAQGAGKLILPISAVVRHAWVADYTNIDAEAQIRIVVNGGDMVHPFRQDVLSQVSSLLAGGGPDGSIGLTHARVVALGDSDAVSPGPVIFSGGAGWYDSDLENFACKIMASNGAAGDFTGGDGGNELTVTVNYSVIDI